MSAPRTGAALAAVLRRELAVSLRQKSEVATPLFFYAVAASLFPLAVGADPALLARLAPGVLWVCALLAALLSLQRLFAADHADGSLEAMALSPTPLPLIAAAKALAHCVLTGLPLVLVAPVLGLQFGLPGRTLGVLMAGLLLGMPCLSLIGSIGAALTLGVRGGGVLLALLVLPLCVPVLVFGAGAVEADQAGLGVEAHFSMLAALLLTSAFGAPFATAAALRIALE